jgi:hypothetical protein
VRLYLSGPINSPIPGLTPEQCRANFTKAEEMAREYWDDVELVNPLKVKVDCRRPAIALGRCMGPFDGHHYDCWMRGDIKALLDCDAILLLPGWTQSRGAVLEQRIAADMGLPHYFTRQDMGGIYG